MHSLKTGAYWFESKPISFCHPATLISPHSSLFSHALLIHLSTFGLMGVGEGEETEVAWMPQSSSLVVSLLAASASVLSRWSRHPLC
ncbi:hypothetical protein VZT92_005428 [Zoarces viviparus]|uniref:Uncharacterized protein n=1 Tax=Zoarces viviparus TaxID=48416 RepID=A0AAW1FUW2_ZOAVI